MAWFWMEFPPEENSGTWSFAFLLVPTDRICCKALSSDVKHEQPLMKAEYPFKNVIYGMCYAHGRRRDFKNLLM